MTILWRENPRKTYSRTPDSDMIAKPTSVRRQYLKKKHRGRDTFLTYMVLCACSKYTLVWIPWHERHNGNDKTDEIDKQNS